MLMKLPTKKKIVINTKILLKNNNNAQNSYQTLKTGYKAVKMPGHVLVMVLNKK